MVDHIMCDVCCEKLTCHNKNIKCQYCEFKACRQCHKTYVFDTTNDFHCMSCKKEWSDDYIATNFTKKMYNTELRNHRENIIVEKEKMFLPNAQECIERYTKYKEYVVHVEKCIQEKTDIWNHYVNNGIILWTRYNQLRTTIESSDTRKAELKRWVTGDKYEQHHHVWVWPCPQEECRGFLNDQLECGVCREHFCRDCHEPMDHEHTCNEEKKKTIKMIKKDSKPCPKCSAVIHKIDGCDQMWCPECKTAFSWTKGTIETKIHNPHYYEYLRDTQGHVPREPDDQCDDGEMPNLPRLMMDHKDHVNMPVYVSIFRIIVHACNYTTTFWGPDVIENHIGEHELKFLRVKYLCRDITYDKWKWQLQKRYKAVRKCNEINQVFDTLQRVAADLFKNDTSNVDDIITQGVHLLKYINVTFEQISKRFNCIAPYFDMHTNDCIVRKY